MRHRTELDRNRQHSRERGDDYRADTRRKIELGGLVIKAGLDRVYDDNRAAIFGALLFAAEQAEDSVLAARCLDRGLRAFNLDREGNDAHALPED